MSSNANSDRPADRHVDGIAERHDRESVQTFGAQTNMQRPAQPEQLSPASVFLAAPTCSGDISGIVLPGSL